MSESRTPGKGNFTADISADAVAEALRSVEKAKGEEPAAIEVEADGGSDDEEEVVATTASAEGTPPGAAPAGGEQIARLEAELALKEQLLEESARRGREAMERLKEANERMLRSAADLENYKRRAQKEKDELQKFGIEKLLRDLLPVLDNFDRALEHARKSQDIESFAQGVAMTQKLFEDTLGRFGVKGFSALGKTFDPHLHEAIQQVESAEHPQNVVVTELVRGYTLHDRLVRPAMVVVSKGPGPGAEAPPAAPPAEGGGESTP